LLQFFLQCIAVCFNCFLHHTILTCCSVLQRVLQYVAAFFPVYCTVFQLSPSPHHPHLLQCVAACVAVCCCFFSSVLQCVSTVSFTPSSPVAVCCSVRCSLPCVAVYCSVFQLSLHHTILTCCSVLQRALQYVAACVAVCCSVRYSVLQCVSTVFFTTPCSPVDAKQCSAPLDHPNIFTCGG